MAANNPDELGALWEQQGSKGPYMTGTINGQRVFVSKNDKKSNERAPDWRVLKAKPREPVTGGAPITEDEIPF